MLERIGTTENIGRNWFKKMFYTILVTDHVPSDPKIPKPIATVETLAKSVFSSKSPLGLLKALDFISQ